MDPQRATVKPTRSVAHEIRRSFDEGVSHRSLVGGETRCSRGGSPRRLGELEEGCKFPDRQVSVIRRDDENHIFKISRDFGSTSEACDEVTHAAGLRRIDNRRKSAQR
jgi:hypothetical protein